MGALFGGGGGGGAQQVTPAVYSQGANPAPYIPSGQASQDQALQQLLTQLGGASGGAVSNYLPQIQSTGATALNNANLVSGLAPNFTGLATSYLNPPQTSPVFQQLSNITGQQAAAANAASGVQGPYAAGNIDNAQNQLALGWQAQMPQLAASLAGTGASLGQAPQSTLSGTLSNVGGALSLPQASAADILAYLNHGLSASNLAGAEGSAGFQQNQQQLGNIGSLLGGGGLGLLGVGGALNAGVGGGLGSTLGSLFGAGGGPFATAAGGLSDFAIPGTATGLAGDVLDLGALFL